MDFPYQYTAVNGTIQREVVTTLSGITLSGSQISQSEVDIPTHGDLIGLEFNITAALTGTLSNPVTLEKVLADFSIKDEGGRDIWSKVNGQDMVQMDRMQSIGRSRTVPTLGNTAETHSLFVPCLIKEKDMTARIQPFFEGYSNLASGATGGSVSLEVVAYYAGAGVPHPKTIRMSHTTQTIGVGTKRYGPQLPKNVEILEILGRVGSESNVSSFTFTKDGSFELPTINFQSLTLQDNVSYVDGHVSGEFRLPIKAFKSTDRTILDTVGAGTDDIEWLVYHQNIEA